MADDRDVADVEVLPVHTCWELVRSADVGRLAMCTDGRPYIFPINFVVDHGTVVFRTGQGTKLAAAIHAPSVAFEVDGYDAGSREAWSVVITGSASEIVNLHDSVDSAQLPLAPWQAGAKTHFVRIEPLEVSGRRFARVDARVWAPPTSGSRRVAPE